MTTTTHDLAAVLRTKIERAIANHPRSLQDALGPSQLGTACDRCLVNLLAGHKPLEGHAPWLPTIGTAVHTWLEDAMRLAAWMDDDGDRWHIEERVVVGDLGGVPVTGSTDLFDAATGTVTVGPRSALSVRVIHADRLKVLHPAMAGDFDALVQVRAHGGVVACRASVREDTMTLELAEPLQGVARGQAAVLYLLDPDGEGDVVLGSGTIHGTESL